jgi:heptosyltransferase-3
LSYRGGITRRIGFGSGGYGSLLTDEILFPSQPNFHLIDALVEELRRIGIDVRGEHIQPYFTPAVEAVHTSHPFASYFHLPFIILHPESGNIKRRLGREFWLRIVQNILRTTDHMVMVCGIARSSSDLSRYLSVSLSNGKDRIIDTVGKLSLDEFFVLSRYARSAFTLESLAAHLCSINCETISFFNNGSGALFFPLPNKKTTVIHNHLPSKDAYVHPKIVNHYVNEIESEETFALLKEIIHSIALPFTAS